MKRVYNKDDFKNMAVDLLCLTSDPRVMTAMDSIGGGLLSYQGLIRAAVILTKLSSTIDPEPIIVEDSRFKETVYSKS